MSGSRDAENPSRRTAAAQPRATKPARGPSSPATRSVRRAGEPVGSGHPRVPSAAEQDR